MNALVQSCGPDLLVQMAIAMWLLAGGFWMMVGWGVRGIWDERRKSSHRAEVHPLRRVK